MMTCDMMNVSVASSVTVRSIMMGGSVVNACWNQFSRACSLWKVVGPFFSLTYYWVFLLGLSLVAQLAVLQRIKRHCGERHGK